MKSSVLITFVCLNKKSSWKGIVLVGQLAGVQCAGNPHFWVNEDGSYQEEGQKNTRGYIWGKVTFVFFIKSVSCFITLLQYSCDLALLQKLVLLVRLERSLYVPSFPCQFLLSLVLHVGFYPPMWLPERFLTTSNME